MSRGDLAAEVQVGQGGPHEERRLERFPGREVEQVDVAARRLVGEVGRDPHPEPLGVRRPRGAVSAETREGRVLLGDARVGVQDVRDLAVEADAHVIGEAGMPLANARRSSQDELEVREVVALVLAQHEESPAGRRGRPSRGGRSPRRT